MSNRMIEVKGLGKAYRLGLKEDIPDTMASALSSWVRRPLQNMRRLRRLNLYDSQTESDDVVWALRDIEFNVDQGDVVGIIGRNGAGKSTLLKILSRITMPTCGVARIHGRVASLLEVGTGFHPELSGRENVYMNGTILGMTKREIDRKFDEIVDFSGVEQFLDTPIKRYSSGMKVRLAFSVAAHLDPEVLVIDEVLAVGDFEFQRKCIGKMGDVASSGKTVLFVSHNMGAVARLCSKGILLVGGRVRCLGGISEVVQRYTQDAFNTNAVIEFDDDPSKQMQIRRIQLVDHEGTPNAVLDRMDSFEVVVDFVVRKQSDAALVTMMIDSLDGNPICHSTDADTRENADQKRPIGEYRCRFTVPGGILNAGSFEARCGAGLRGQRAFDSSAGLSFQLIDQGSFAADGSRGRQRPGIVAIPLKCSTISIT